MLCTNLVTAPAQIWGAQPSVPDHDLTDVYTVFYKNDFVDPNSG